MALEIHEELGGKTLEVRASGKLRRENYRRFVPRVEQLIREHGKIRVLFDMRDFRGWDAGALWEDIKFNFRHYRDVERLALVGEKRWQKAMGSICRPFTTAKIRYFDRREIDRAREWIHEGVHAEATGGGFGA